MAHQKYSDNELIETLKKYAEKIKRTPTYAEFEREKTVPSATLYKKRFGSWNEAILKANLKSNAIRKFNKQDIINEVLNFYHQNGRAPNYNELKYTIVHVKNHWNGWSDMLEDLNIPFNRRFSTVKDERGLLKFIKELSTNIGRIPTGKDIEMAGVNRNLYTQKFGSLKNAMIKAGVIEANHYRSMKDRVPDSLQAIKEYYQENGKAPSVEEYEIIAKEKNLAHRKALEQELGKRYTEICMEYIGVANQYKRSKKELIEDLINLKKKLGRVPLTDELVQYGLAEKKQYYRTFNMTYNQLVKSLGWEPPYKRSLKTIDDLLEDYHVLYKKLGRIPFYEDINNTEGLAHAETYKKYFGDLSSIWGILDIQVNEEIIKKNFGTGTACVDKRGDICRSYQEMIITNLLIDLELEYSKEVPYKELFPQIKKKITADWLLKEPNIFIEYFGLFSEKQLEKDNKIGRYSRNVLEKLKLCRKYNIKIIDLYPKDMEEIEEVLINRLQQFNVI